LVVLLKVVGATTAPGPHLVDSRVTTPTWDTEHGGAQGG